MNILILPTAYPNIYNDHSSIFVQDQVEALVKYNVKVSVVGVIPISFKYIFSQRIFKFGHFKAEKDGVSSHLFLYPAIPKLRKFNQFLRDKINKYLINKYLLSNSIDIVHVHNATVGNMAIWIKETYSIPFVITEHSSNLARGLLRNNEIKKFKSIYKNAVERIAVSEEFCILLKNTYSLDFKYIPNVVDIDYFQINNKKDKNAFNFINIANLNKNKNQSLLIEAFSKMFKEHKNVKLSIVGDGSEYNTLNYQIQLLGMEKQIKLYGFATREEVLRELQSADVFVLSSKYETFGVVIIEAMSCGLPVVATNCGGPESIITNDELGILVKNNSLEELSTAIKDIYTYKDNYSKQTIRNYVIDNFSQKEIALKLINIYTKVLSDVN